MKTIRLGAGAGFAGDRIEPAQALAQQAQLDYLIFEALAERTIALAQQRKQADAQTGYDLLLEARFRAVLPACVANRTKIITNMGAANPLAAAQRVRKLADSMGLTQLKIASVTGDNVTDYIKAHDLPLLETGQSSQTLKSMLSANAYLGVTGIVQALELGADVVITGRVADPALYLAPCVYEFGWELTDWERLGKGTAVGHLLECAGQLTGGYYADPVKKPVAGLANLGFPYADVDALGNAVFSKLAQSGGELSIANCTEQLLYEIHDPHCYLTPDVQADFSQVQFTQVGPSQIAIQGASGREKSGLLKVSIGYQDGYVGTGEIAYAGPSAKERAELAYQVVQERLQQLGVDYSELRGDLIGVSALHGDAISTSYQRIAPYEVLLRVSGRTQTREAAQTIGNEVEALYTNGPAGGGGAKKWVKEIVAVASVLIPEQVVQPIVKIWETSDASL
ncbi:acyclic terpene utilization AtuA family protein [Paenalcaligenes sp.]|uniref:acyclic terpene utilization AtuA family protein n=1 Tax=Paenalcaligenes sp. TaxID=1966342 RepID=UPI00261BA9D0|nr:acyclic terpene utilization AtuA family protein [Paenalcaligenes sp.]